MELRPKVSWLTNHPAPYRLPVWEHMGQTVDLEVLLLASRPQFAASPGNRGREWGEVTPVGYAMRDLRTWRALRGEDRYYLTKPGGLRLRPDTSAVVIAGWESPSYLQTLMAAKLRRIATIGFYESTLLSQTRQRGPVAALRRSFFRRLDAVVVPGEAAEEAILAMDLPHLRIFRGFNAVDVSTIHAAVSASRQQHADSDSTPSGHRYLYIGQLVARKNVTSALAAFAAAAVPGDTMTVTGKGDLQDELQALNIPGVSFTGPIPYDALADLLARHDTLVLPSTVEVWGLVVNEALAAGLHVTVSDRCGVAPSVRGMAGVTVVAPTVEGIRAGMVRSRESWRGPIAQPEILAHDPREFAGTFLDAIEYGMSLRKSAKVHR
jgi:glycosyltransferase involved in cell wall biosynthesis